MITAKEALIQSIYKYNWRALHPAGEFPRQWRHCHLCIAHRQRAREFREITGSSSYPCGQCPMHWHWPTESDCLSNKCVCVNSLWLIQEELASVSAQFEEVKITHYDRAFFCLLLVEAFHDRLRELYK